MIIDNEEWEEMMTHPEVGTKCKVLILKEMVYKGKDEKGQYIWQDILQGKFEREENATAIFKFIGWQPSKEN